MMANKDKMIDKQKILIKTRRLVLRVLRSRDVTEDYVDGLNDATVNEYLVPMRLRRQTLRGVKKYVVKNWNDKSSILLGIFLKNEKRLIGTLRISEIGSYHYLCLVGICIFDKRFWGNGYGSEALRNVVAFIFNKLKLHYVEAGVFKINKSSFELFRKAGFIVIAHLKDKYRHGNSFKESVIFGKVNPRFDHNLLK